VEFFAKYGMDRRRMFLFPLEPDYAAIEALTPQQIEAVRERFQLSAARRRIVYSGRLIELKRVDLIIDAFAAIAAERPQWDLLIVGDGPLRQELERRVPSELRSRVTWTGFVDDPSVLAALYKLSDVLVLASNHDAWALVINEAAAAGLAIICTEVVGAAPELVRQPLNGYLFPVGDLNALKERLLLTTAADRIDAMKAASVAIVSDWRARADPVAGLRQALCSVGVLKS
jgi:glycosyltransferase involved in cell wall biosynthesis